MCLVMIWRWRWGWGGVSCRLWGCVVRRVGGCGGRWRGIRMCFLGLGLVGVFGCRLVITIRRWLLGCWRCRGGGVVWLVVLGGCWWCGCSGLLCFGWGGGVLSLI